ncbi:MAG: DNA repair protein RadC [Pseudomonadota bacterium]
MTKTKTMTEQIPRTTGTDGHRRRLREKFLESGLSGFHDYEVIELLLTLNTPRRDCKESAKELLRRFKTLQGVLEAAPGELTRISGVGPANIFGLKLVREVAERYQKKRLMVRDSIRNSGDLLVYLNQSIAHRTKEVFAGIFLDARNRVLAADILFEGSLTASSVYPREVIVRALEHRAASVMFAHNHPSGDALPSAEDISVTKRLVFALRHVGIVVHEHMIIGRDSSYSLADHGCIAQFNREFDSDR